MKKENISRDINSINNSINNIIQSHERKKEADNKKEKKKSKSPKKCSISRSNSNSIKKQRNHRKRHRSRSRSNKSSSLHKRKNKSKHYLRSSESKREMKENKKEKKENKAKSKSKKKYSDDSQSDESVKKRSRSRSISYNTFKRKERRHKDRRSSSSLSGNYREEKGYSSEASFDSEKFENKLNSFRNDKLYKSNRDRRAKHLENNKDKGNNVFNRSLLSNIIQENIRNNRKADQEEIERATKKLYEIDQEAFNKNKQAKLMSTLINEPKRVLDKEDMSYEIVDGEFKPVYKPCVCIYKNCGKRFIDSLELTKHMKSHLE